MIQNKNRNRLVIAIIAVYVIAALALASCSTTHCGGIKPIHSNPLRQVKCPR